MTPLYKINLLAYALRGIALHQLHERVTSLEQEIEQLKELLRLQQDPKFLSQK